MAQTGADIWLKLFCRWDVFGKPWTWTICYSPLGRWMRTDTLLTWSRSVLQPSVNGSRFILVLDRHASHKHLQFRNRVMCMRGQLKLIPGGCTSGDNKYNQSTPGATYAKAFVFFTSYIKIYNHLYTKYRWLSQKLRKHIVSQLLNSYIVPL